MYGGYIAVNTAIIAVQTLFSVLELRGSTAVQAVCLLLTAAVNFKFIAACVKNLFHLLNGKRRTLWLF